MKINSRFRWLDNQDFLLRLNILERRYFRRRQFRHCNEQESVENKILKLLCIIKRMSDEWSSENEFFLSFSGAMNEKIKKSLN